jgi:hypothetical protein
MFFRNLVCSTKQINPILDFRQAVRDLRSQIAALSLIALLLTCLAVPFVGATLNPVVTVSGNDASVSHLDGVAPTQEVDWMYNPQDPSNSTGLVGRWSFNEGSGVIAHDTSGNGNDGTLYNSPNVSWASGKFGYALNFNGGDGYVSIPNSNSLMPTSSVTVEAWVKRVGIDPSGNAAIFEKRPPSNDAGYFLDGVDARFYIYADGSWANTERVGATPADGIWHFIVGTYDGSQIKVYVDGVLKDTVSKSGNITSTTAEAMIGRSLAAPNNPFIGTIDEVRVYDRALSSEEIMTDYLEGDITETTYNHYWVESGTNATYRWDFNVAFPANSSGQIVNVTFPNGHQVLNITYPVGENLNAALPTDTYAVLSYNSTHQILILPESTIDEYGGNYTLFTTTSNAISDTSLEVNPPSPSYTYFAPGKEVLVCIQTIDPHGNAIDTSASLLIFTEEGSLLNMTEGISSSGWFNCSTAMPSVEGEYWLAGNCSGNYAGMMTTQIYVSKISASFNIDNSRESVSKAATISGTAKYTVDNSSVPSGKIIINGTEYPISSGSFTFNDVESTVGKWTFKVDSVTDGGGCDALQSNTVAYVIWDRIKIIEGGVTENSTNVGQTVIVWFKAVYEYDGEPFNGDDGRLCLGGPDWWVAMDWSATDNRWEYQYTARSPGIETFEVVQVFDDKYGITTLNDQAGPQSISCSEPLITTVGQIALVCAIVAAVTLLLIVMGRKGTHTTKGSVERNRLEVNA